MAKQNKFTVEKFNGNREYLPYFIGGITADVLCANEEDAKRIADALNMAEDIKAMRRKAVSLHESLSQFIGD